MKTIVISYSWTGNNEALATSIAKELKAEHIRVTEAKHRTMVTIIWDTLFNRTPQVTPAEIKVKENELVVFVGPVWMGMTATPFRAYFEQLKDKLNKYAYISISGGAIGANPKLGDELEKRLGKKPMKVINLFIADLLPAEPKPQMKDTQAYRLSDKDVESLTRTVVKTLKEL